MLVRFYQKLRFTDAPPRSFFPPPLHKIISPTPHPPYLPHIRTNTGPICAPTPNTDGGGGGGDAASSVYISTSFYLSPPPSSFPTLLYQFPLPPFPSGGGGKAVKSGYHRRPSFPPFPPAKTNMWWEDQGDEGETECVLTATEEGGGLMEGGR